MSMMKISQRGAAMPFSPIRFLTPFADAAKARGIKIYHLNIGQPDIETPEPMWKAMHEYKEKVLAYGPSQGLLEYRKALVRYYQHFKIDVTPDQIMVTTAGSEAIIFTFLAIADKDGEIIVPEPFYTNYNGFAVMAEVKLVPITTKAEEGYHLPKREVIESKINKKTKAILICNPNNPTGTIYTPEEVHMLADIAKKHDIYFIADEVYREFSYINRPPLSVMQLEGLDDRAICVDSISKRYSACGARIGCIVTRNPEIYSVVLRMGQARLCPPTLEQIGGMAGVDLNPQYMQNMINEYESRRDVTYDMLMKVPEVVCQKPEGAFYITAKLPIKDAADFAKWLLQEFNYQGESVMVAPAAGFYATPGLGLNEIRLAYVLKKEDCKRGMEVFKIGMEKYISLGGDKKKLLE
jgi:aspartate aminotransferase